MSDVELIQRIKLDDQQAFSLLYEKYWSTVYHFASLYVNHKNVVEDVVQEVFLKIWQLRLRLREEDTLDGLMFITTRNIIFNLHRKQVNAKACKDTILRSANAAYSLEERIYARDLLEQIERFVEELPEKRREVFFMSRSMNLSNAQIAEKLQVSEKTVENHIYESLRFLRKKMDSFWVFFL